jgi:hypothetical protein
MPANLDAGGSQAQQVIHPDDRVRGYAEVGACTYLQQIPLGDCVSGFIVSLFSDRFLFSVRNEP